MNNKLKSLNKRSLILKNNDKSVNLLPVDVRKVLNYFIAENYNCVDRKILKI